ncbi:angiopoietin-2-like isoform X1 [Pelobates cultripes]|uniref:Angiopoietin-2-like isoform X1 n=1 Tax=Pelobates cultripes TaxID=61616 RepID=A0AAD1R2V9_PELCU|nr:angiopoietin-2-like isoform X1 [Pelobates cultripes]CAH2221939.1 angiopoietin-2-like isoform X1 [Pelobates cultripes]CAH2221940.1 angiopoietin-2-like isoform X1 [Pelobates cultripes]
MVRTTMVQQLSRHCFLFILAYIVMGSQVTEKHHHKIQHGHCSYTFLLPETDSCHPPPADFQVSNSLQMDAPPQPEHLWPTKRLQELESIMENNTQWLQKLDSYIHEGVKNHGGDSHNSAVQNQTATMLEIGTNLLTQTAEQTRKLTNVETQVLNQTTRLEIQLLENSLFTNKLEKELLVQIQEINKLHEKNSYLENKVLMIEEKHKEEIAVLKTEKLKVDEQLFKQRDLIGELGEQLTAATLNNSMLQRQQAHIMESMGHLADLVSQYNHIPDIPKQEQMTFRDCADAYKAGYISTGVYTLRLLNTTDTVNALCDMETSGGGWTVIQHRKDGSVNFHRVWKEYKDGFGSPSGEYWLGNDFVHQLTIQGNYELRIQLQDWDGNEANSLYEHFSLASEDLNYKLQLGAYSGTAGRTSSFSPTGTDFSTKDVDNDRCSCRCAQMASGGWWFDACGPSNLNGIYYPGGHSTAKFNSIKWHYWKGPSHGLKTVSMMIRPVDF